jgi:ankyrin repeat protein
MVDAGAEPTSINFEAGERPLEISKDKFSRDVLQNLNDAANEGNSSDLQYLVNCGEVIDERIGITGEAPIHKAVLSNESSKNAALNAIIKCNANLDTLDANGWTALHHAAYTGDIDSAKTLLE